MNTHDPDTDLEFEEEPIEIEVRKAVGGVVSVRFNPAEIRELREEVSRTGEKTSAFVRSAALAEIRARRQQRQAGVSIQSSTASLLRSHWSVGGRTIRPMLRANDAGAAARKAWLQCSEEGQIVGQKILSA